MANVSLSNLATTTYKNVAIMTAQDAAYFDKSRMSTFKAERNGGANWIVPIFGASSPSHAADGSDVSAGSGYTPTSVTVNLFDPLKVSDVFKMSDLATNESYIPTQVSARFGADCGLTQSNVLLNILGKSAQATSNGTAELAGTSTEDAVSDSTFTDGVFAAIANLKKKGYRTSELFCALRPEPFLALRRNAYVASADYIKSGMTDNATMAGTMKIAGVTFLDIGSSWLGTNTASNTNIPTSARWDARKAWGVMWHPCGLGVYETEPFDADIVDLPHVFGVMPYVRTTYGAAILQANASVVIANLA